MILIYKNRLIYLIRVLFNITQIQGQEVPALVNTSSHISLISTRLMNVLELRREVTPDKTVPASPLDSSKFSIHKTNKMYTWILLCVSDILFLFNTLTMFYLKFSMCTNYVYLVRII